MAIIAKTKLRLVTVTLLASLVIVGLPLRRSPPAIRTNLTQDEVKLFSRQTRAEQREEILYLFKRGKWRLASECLTRWSREDITGIWREGHHVTVSLIDRSSGAFHSYGFHPDGDDWDSFSEAIFKSQSDYEKAMLRVQERHLARHAIIRNLWIKQRIAEAGRGDPSTRSTTATSPATE